MENQIEIISYKDQKVRVLNIDDKFCFFEKDMAQLFGYINSLKDIRDHGKEEDKKSWAIETKRGKQSTKIINK